MNPRAFTRDAASPLREGKFDEVISIATQNMRSHVANAIAEVLTAYARRRAHGIPRLLQCAVKGAGPQREINPPGNWIAPPGSNRSGGGDNKAAGASGVEGRVRRLGESAGCNASER